MMNYLPFERRSRHQFIEQSIDKTEQALNTPEASMYLGAAACTTLRDQLSHYTIPNVRDGFVTMPDDVDSEDIPIVASNIGEMIRYEISSANLTPTQRAIAQMGLLMEYPGLVNLPEHTLTGTNQLTKGTLATTKARNTRFNFPDGRRFILRTRPLVILKQTRKIDSTLFHETVHVHQVLTHPLTVDPTDEMVHDENTRFELEAYMKEYAVAPAFARVGAKKPSAMARQVNTLVKNSPEYRPDDPYRLNDPLRQALNRHVPYI